MDDPDREMMNRRSFYHGISGSKVFDNPSKIICGPLSTSSGTLSDVLRGLMRQLVSDNKVKFFGTSRWFPTFASKSKELYVAFRKFASLRIGFMNLRVVPHHQLLCH